MEAKNIRILADMETYAILLEEQENYQIANQRKISLADVILHYFYEGYNNATDETDTGLRIIPEEPEEVKSESISQLSGGGEYTNYELLESTLGKFNNKLEAIDSLNKQFGSLENLLQTIKNNSFQNNRQDSNNSQLLAAQMENVKLTVENSNLKSDLDFNKKYGGNSNLDDKFKEIKKSLEIIEKQTKKSIIEKILPYANPILLILHHFLTDKKLNSNLNLNDLLEKVKPIITNLADEEQEIVNSFIQKAVEDFM